VLSHKTLKFLAQSIGVGLLAALLLVVLSPLGSSLFKRLEAINTYNNGPFSYSKAVTRASPAVVNIYTKKQIRGTRRLSKTNPQLDRLLQNLYGQPYDRTITSLGSGVIVAPDGHILTNHHVIEHAQEIEISTTDGRQFQAYVVGVDPDTDLAVLKINADNLLSISLGDSNALKTGDVVLAIGNPYGLGQTVSQGIISATGRNQLGINVFENYIQTDAAIHPGNSGGALINASGELIGINTITSLEGGNSIGIGFAIPSLLAQEMMSDMITHGRVLRGWMGVRVQNITPQLSQSFALGVSKGVIVSNVIRNSPAHMAGLTLGDVITHINEEPVFYERQILNQVIAYRPGDAITLKGLRRGQTIEWQIQIAQRPIYGTSY